MRRISLLFVIVVLLFIIGARFVFNEISSRSTPSPIVSEQGSVSIPVINNAPLHEETDTQVEPIPPSEATELITEEKSTNVTEATPKEPELPSFTKETLAQYDGTDPSLPIYLAFEGNVYDVSEGKKFYAPGGSYHFLAGTDGTRLLRTFGGDTIKKKYPVVGIYTP